MTSGGWHYRDVPRTSVLNVSAKRISLVIFSVLVHQMCVLDTKTLVYGYSFSFGETSWERLKNVLNWYSQCDVLGTSSGRQFNHYPSNRFLWKFFYISWCQSDIVEQEECKKPNTSYFVPIMIWDVSTKIGPWGDVLGMLCVGWDISICFDKNVPHFIKRPKIFLLSLKEHPILELAQPLCFPADISRRWCKLNFGP